MEEGACLLWLGVHFILYLGVYYHETAQYVMHVFSTFSLPRILNMWKSNFPCVSLESMGEKKDSAWLSNLTKSPINISCCLTNTCMSLQYSPPPPLQHVGQKSSEVPVEKRPHWEMSVEINKAIFCWVSSWHFGYLLWRGFGGRQRGLAVTGCVCWSTYCLGWPISHRSY